MPGLSKLVEEVNSLGEFEPLALYLIEILNFSALTQFNLQLNWLGGKSAKLRDRLRLNQSTGLQNVAWFDF